MIIKYLLPAAIFFILFSCKKDDGIETITTFSEVAEVTLPSTAFIGERVSIDVLHFGDGSCSSPGGYDATTSEDTITYNFYQKIRNENCTAHIEHFNTTVITSFSKKGTYYLKFRQYDNQYLLDSIQVK